MPQWREWLRNRWVWVAAGGGALAGLAVLLYRRGQSGGAATPPTAEAPGYGPGGMGYLDTTATDVAEQLGRAQAEWQRMFDQFTADVNRRLSEGLAPSPETPPRPPRPVKVITPPDTQAGVIPPPPPATPSPTPPAPTTTTTAPVLTFGDDPIAMHNAIQAYRARTGR